jgi:AcrR family transcriptional regulator
MNKPSLRERILEAADQVARERGVANLTLDLVAEQANVSKGGLLYHFTTKEALLTALVDRAIERYRAHLRAAADRYGSDYRGYLKASMLARKESDENSECLRALFAAAAHFPKMPERACNDVKEHYDHLRTDASRFEDAAILSLAIDGLNLLELLGLAPFSPQEREAVVARLMEKVEKL